MPRGVIIISAPEKSVAEDPAVELLPPEEEDQGFSLCFSLYERLLQNQEARCMCLTHWSCYPTRPQQTICSILQKKKGHKGRGKQFSNPEEIDRQMRLQREMEEKGGAEKESSSESEEESSSDEESESKKRSGVEGLIEIENPNRVSQKSKKVTEIDVAAPRELSRREREEIEKQKSKERYMKLHLEGKTEQARADLARLAIIKKQREEAAKKREELRKVEEAQAKR